MSEWRDLGLKDDQALRSYITEKFSEGRYWLEPQDQHNRKIDKLPGWVIDTEEDDNMPDFDEYDDRRRSRRKGRRRSRRPLEDDDDFDDFDEGDIVESRAGIADYLSTKAKAESEERLMEKKSSNDMMSMMIMMQQQQQQTAREERERDRLREEARREEARREDERRREDQRREEERRRTEEQRNYEARLEREREERRREAEQIRIQMEASAKRTEMMVGALTAALPTLGKLFEKGQDPVTMTLLSKLSEKGADPMMMMMMKHFMEKSNKDDGLTSMIQSMGEMSRVSNQMMLENMKGMFASMSEMQQENMKQQLRMALANPNRDDEEKSTIQQVLEAISGGVEMVSSLARNSRQAQQAQPQPVMVQPAPSGFVQQQPQHPQIAHQPPPPPQQQHQQAPEVPEQIGQAPGQEQVQLPTGVEAVVGGIVTILSGTVTDPDMQEQVVNHMISEMPQELGQAIVEQDEGAIMSICTPVFLREQELQQWIMEPANAQAVREWLPTLIPRIQQARQPLPEGAQTGSDDEDEDDTF